MPPAVPSGSVRHLRVCGGPGQYAGWPANGGLWCWGHELLVGFTLGAHKEQVGHTLDRETARPVFARSLDGGDSWKLEPAGLPAGSAPPPLPETLDFTAPGFAATFRGTHAHYSTDRGRSWLGPYPIPDVEGQPVQGRTDYLVEGAHALLALLTVAKRDGLEGRVGAFRARDGGRSWSLVSWVGPEPDGFAIMPATVRLSASRLLCVVRCRTGIHRWLSRTESEDRNWLSAWFSEDNAESWHPLPDPVADTGWGGSPPALVRLTDGRLCLAYAWRGHRLEEPSRLCVRYSGDAGASWGPEIVLRDGDGANFDVGYPRLAQRPDGTLVLLYYYNHALRETPSYRYIAATLFTPHGSGPCPANRPIPGRLP